MTVLTPARPDLAAYREATSMPFAELVRQLVEIVGRKLTAYIGGIKDVRAVERWMAGAEPYKNAEERLRFTFRLVRMLSQHEHSKVVQAWLTGLNPELNDRVPLRLLREGNLEEVGPALLGAARAFVAGG